MRRIKISPTVISQPLAQGQGAKVVCMTSAQIKNFFLKKKFYFLETEFKKINKHLLENMNCLNRILQHFLKLTVEGKTNRKMGSHI